MSTTAWSALAGRFAALANEQEFRFTTYPFNTPTAFEDDRDRFRLAYPFGGSPDAPTSVGIVIGQGSFRRGEFVRINRFRWLSWAAGLLLNTDPCSPPEIHWWRRLREIHLNRIDTDGATNRATLHDLAYLSAETARQLAASNGLTPAPPTSAKPDNWPAIQESLQLFRERFNAERWHTARPDAALVAFPDHAVFESWKRSVVDPTAPDQFDPRAWAMRGTAWGDTEPVEAFVNLATDAGTALPLELTFTPPMFPWFNTLSNMRPAPVASWLEFLFVTCPACFTVQLDTPVPYSRVARLTTSAFTTSVNAIDRVKRLDAAAFLRQFRTRAIRCNPWLDGTERVAASAAVEAAAQPANTCEPSVAKPRHWTEYPERVEKFDDLLSILETLDRHEMDRGFTAESFKNSRGRTTAYTVDFHPHTRQHQFHPQLDQMPGLERLLDRFDIDGYPTLTQSQARELRRRAAKALNRDGASLNAMRFTEIMDALEAAKRPPVPPTASNSPNGGMKTFGDFLADVCAVEQAAASTRADADAMGGDPGSAHLRMQAGVFEATAAYRSHPSFPFLEAHVDRHCGPFTYAHLLRVRGEVCAARHCGTTEVDRLPVEEVVAALGCPGAPVTNPSHGGIALRQVNTRPASVEPPRQFVDAAMRALPSALNNAPQPQGVHDPAGRRGADYAILRKRLEDAGHNRDAVEWAIHRHVEADRLEATPGLTGAPGVISGEQPARLVTNHTYERERCVLWGPLALWEWWTAIENGQLPANGASMSTNATASTQANPAEQSPTTYTMSDIRTLLLYKREMADFEEWRRSTFKPVMKAEEIGLRAASMALNTPQPGRLSEEIANTLAVYRRLLRESRTVLNKELDEPVLLYFVGEVADRHRRLLNEIWSLPTDEFDRLMDTLTAGADSLESGNSLERQQKGDGGTTVTGSKPNAPAPPDESRFVFATTGKMYYLSGFGENGYFPLLKGLGVLAKLVRTPGVPVPWAELDPAMLYDGSRTSQPTFDDEGGEGYRATVQRLRSEIATAENEVERADSQRKLDELTAHLRPVTGLKGKARDINNPINSLRPKIWGQIKTVFDKLREATPPMTKLADHFEQCIDSNTDGFVYNPPAPIPRWQTEPETK